jgi:hypothetical protein
MPRKRVLIVNVLKPRHLLLRKLGFSAIIYVKSGIPAEQLPGGAGLIHIYDGFAEANNRVFAMLSERLKQYRKKFPQLFVYKDYNLTEALEKDVFWGYMVQGLIAYQLEKIGGGVVLNLAKRSASTRFFSLLRLLFESRAIYTFEGKLVNVPAGAIAFRINDGESVPLYGNLFQKLKRSDLIAYQNVFAPFEDYFRGTEHYFAHVYRCAEVEQGKDPLPGRVSRRILFRSVDKDFANVIVRCYYRLANHIDEYERLANAGVGKFVLLAGENEGEGNVLCAVASKFGLSTFNYMNGAKAEEHQNRRTYFTKWFMPEERTKAMIESYSDIDPDSLPVTGHLLEEVAAAHEYNGTLDFLKDTLRGRKIIAYFGSPLLQTEQREVQKLLQEYIREHRDVVVLVRRHPLDKNNFPVSGERFITLPYYQRERLNIALFDLLLTADIAISFSSTISYQATWFGKPSINYEKSATSRLKHIDGKSAFQATDIAALKELLDRFIIGGQRVEQPTRILNASDHIAAYLTNTRTEPKSPQVTV